MSDKKLKFSVVTVSFNSEDTIEQTIQSVIEQPYDNIEYIIIDGGSTDSTIDIIKKYEKNIYKWTSGPDKGIFDAMNKGLSFATGEVVSFLNSDDWYEKEIFEKLNFYFVQNPEIDIVAACPINVEGGEKIRESFSKKNPKDAWYKILYAHPSTFQRKKMFDEIGGYDINYSLGADIEWYLRAYLAGAKFLDVREWTTYFRKNGASAFSISKVYEEFKEFSLKAVEKNNDPELRYKIKTELNRKIEETRIQDAFLKNWENSVNLYKEKLDLNQKYYIWGSGLHGFRCMRLLKAVGAYVEAFVESEPAINERYGTQIISPDKIKPGGAIIICSLLYEDEIRKTITGYNLDQARVLSFVEIEKMADI